MLRNKAPSAPRRAGMAMILSSLTCLDGCLCTHPADNVGIDAAQPFSLSVRAAQSHERGNGTSNSTIRTGCQRSTCHPKQHYHFSGIPESQEVNKQSRKRKTTRQSPVLKNHSLQYLFW